MSLAIPTSRFAPVNTLTPLVRSEWIKLRSLRSSKWTLAAMVVVTVGIGALFSALMTAHWDTA